MHDQTRTVIYVGVEHAVVHALLEWSDTREGVVEHLDGSDHVRIAEFCGGGLFGGSSFGIVSGIEQVPFDVLAGVGNQTHLAAGVVRKDSKPTKALQALTGVADVIGTDRRWIEREIVAMFTRRGVALDPGARGLLIERCSDDLSRARSVAIISQMAGIERLGVNRCRQLLGSGGRDAKTYEIVDALLDGKLEQAFSEVETVETIPLTIALSETMRQLVVAGEVGSADALAVALHIHPYAAKRRVAHQRKWGPEAVGAALAAACVVERSARRGSIRSRDALARVAIALGGLV